MRGPREFQASERKPVFVPQAEQPKEIEKEVVQDSISERKSFDTKTDSRRNVQENRTTHQPFKKVFAPLENAPRSATESGSSIRGRDSASSHSSSLTGVARKSENEEQSFAMKEPVKEVRHGSTVLTTGHSPQGVAPISLKTLQHQSGKTQTASTQNADELRKTLQEALSGLKQNQNDNPPSVPTQKEDVDKAKQENVRVQENTSATPPVSEKKEIPEIPEDELRKMLDIKSP